MFAGWGNRRGRWRGRGGGGGGGGLEKKISKICCWATNGKDLIHWLLAPSTGRFIERLALWGGPTTPEAVQPDRSDVRPHYLCVLYLIFGLLPISFYISSTAKVKITDLLFGRIAYDLICYFPSISYMLLYIFERIVYDDIFGVRPNSLCLYI